MRVVLQSIQPFNPESNAPRKAAAALSTLRRKGLGVSPFHSAASSRCGLGPAADQSRHKSATVPTPTSHLTIGSSTMAAEQGRQNREGRQNRDIHIPKKGIVLLFRSVAPFWGRGRTRPNFGCPRSSCNAHVLFSGGEELRIWMEQGEKDRGHPSKAEQAPLDLAHGADNLSE
jgi:hypothetical protein